MSTEPKATTAAPNNTTGQTETAVVPEKSEEPVKANATTTDTAKPAEAPKSDVSTTSPIEDLWQLAKKHDHPEIWGVLLADPATHVPSQIVFQKFLNAYDGDLVRAKDTLTRTLDWRHQTKPLELLKKAHAKGKFDGLGYVTAYGSALPGEKDGKEVFSKFCALIS